MANESPDEGREQVPPDAPGAIDSSLLALDAAQTLLQLVKAELRQWLTTLPELLLVDLYRLPLLLLTWISFGVLVACAVFAASGNLVFSVGSFFVLQLAFMLVLERYRRRLHSRMEFRETRKGLLALQTSLEERFGRGG